jgi:hypothetical protein
MYWRLYGRQLDWAPFLRSADVPQQKSAVLSLTVVPKSTMNAPSPVGITSKSAVVEAGADYLRMLTMLRMNLSLLEYIRTEYDGLHSRIEASETRINKDLCDKAEEQARESATMDST